MNTLVHRIAGGEHQDQRFPARLAQASEHVPSVLAGKHDIENDQVELNFEGEVQTLQAIFGNVHDIAGLAQAFLQELGSLCFVFDNEDFHDEPTWNENCLLQTCGASRK